MNNPFNSIKQLAKERLVSQKQADSPSKLKKKVNKKHDRKQSDNCNLIINNQLESTIDIKNKLLNLLTSKNDQNKKIIFKSSSNSLDFALGEFGKRKKSSQNRVSPNNINNNNYNNKKTPKKNQLYFIDKGLVINYPKYQFTSSSEKKKDQCSKDAQLADAHCKNVQVQQPPGQFKLNINSPHYQQQLKRIEEGTGNHVKLASGKQQKNDNTIKKEAAAALKQQYLRRTNSSENPISPPNLHGSAAQQHQQQQQQQQQQQHFKKKGPPPSLQQQFNNLSGNNNSNSISQNNYIQPQLQQSPQQQQQQQSTGVAQLQYKKEHKKNTYPNIMNRKHSDQIVMRKYSNDQNLFKKKNKSNSPENRKPQNQQQQMIQHPPSAKNSKAHYKDQQHQPQQRLSHKVQTTQQNSQLQQQQLPKQQSQQSITQQYQYSQQNQPKIQQQIPQQQQQPSPSAFKKNTSYKKRRPQEIDIEQEEISTQEQYMLIQSQKNKQIASAGNASSQQQQFISKSVPGSTKHADISKNTFATPKNDFVDEQVKKSSQKKGIFQFSPPYTAGPGCIALSDYNNSARSAVYLRGAAGSNQEKLQLKGQQQQQQHSLSQQSNILDSASNNLNLNLSPIVLAEMLEKVYLKSSRLLNKYKARELKWQREKKALADEIKFLKTLLSSHDNIQNIIINN